LYERYKSTFGQNDPDTLCVLGTSREFNETLDAQIIEAELAKDPERASSEYLSIWRDDLSSYIGRDIVEGLIDRGVHERAPQPGTRHVGFVDEAGGGSSGGDASTLSICHIDRDRRVIQDVIRVWKPPFSPAQVIAEKAQLLKAYRIARVTADRWAFGLAADVYRANGIKCEQAPKNKSDLYQDFQALLNSS